MTDKTQPGLRIALGTDRECEERQSLSWAHALGLTIVGERTGRARPAYWMPSHGYWGRERNTIKAARNGAMSDPFVAATLNNGIPGRAQKNSTLAVIDPRRQAQRTGSADAFVSGFAIDLPSLWMPRNKEKAQILLPGSSVSAISSQNSTWTRPTLRGTSGIGQNLNAKTKHAEELPEFPDVPTGAVEHFGTDNAAAGHACPERRTSAKRDALNHLSIEVGRRGTAGGEPEAGNLQPPENWSTVLADFNSASKKCAGFGRRQHGQLEKQIADKALNAQIAANAQKQAAQGRGRAVPGQYAAEDLRSLSYALTVMAFLTDSPHPLPDQFGRRRTGTQGQKWDQYEFNWSSFVWLWPSSASQLEVHSCLWDKLSRWTLTSRRTSHRWSPKTCAGYRESVRAMECSIIYRGWTSH